MMGSSPQELGWLFVRLWNSTDSQRVILLKALPQQDLKLLDCLRRKPNRLALFAGHVALPRAISIDGGDLL